MLTIIRKHEYDKLEKDFNQDFFENGAKRRQKEKELLKLERGDDYSEADYEYYMRNNNDADGALSEEKDNENEDYELDFDDNSDLLEKEEMKLNASDGDDEPFNPIKYLGEKLKRLHEGQPETPESSEHEEEQSVNESFKSSAKDSQ